MKHTEMKSITTSYEWHPDHSINPLSAMSQNRIDNQTTHRHSIVLYQSTPAKFQLNKWNWSQWITYSMQCVYASIGIQSVSL